MVRPRRRPAAPLHVLPEEKAEIDSNENCCLPACPCAGDVDQLFGELYQRLAQLRRLMDRKGEVQANQKAGHTQQVTVVSLEKHAARGDAQLSMVGGNFLSHGLEGGLELNLDRPGGRNSRQAFMNVILVVETLIARKRL